MLNDINYVMQHNDQSAIADLVSDSIEIITAIEQTHHEEYIVRHMQVQAAAIKELNTKLQTEVTDPRNSPWLFKQRVEAILYRMRNIATLLENKTTSNHKLLCELKEQMAVIQTAFTLVSGNILATHTNILKV